MCSGRVKHALTKGDERRCLEGHVVRQRTDTASGENVFCAIQGIVVGSGPSALGEYLEGNFSSSMLPRSSPPGSYQLFEGTRRG
jgi:hypothetical protein